MISKEQVFEIHRLNNDGYSQRKIARLLGIGRQTVRDYLETPEKAYKTRKKRGSKLDAYKPIIKQYLEEDPEVCAPVIYEKIKYRGYSGGATILRNYLREIRGESKSRQVFLRIESQPGEEVQVDWGHFDAISYEDTPRKLYALAAIESYSRMLYVEFTHSQKQAVLHRCLLNAFRYFGGTPKQILVDNMATAVIEREGRLIRFNDAFLNFLRPLKITPKACNKRSPNEKGKIENSIKYLRNNFMPLRRFSDLKTVQTQAMEWLESVANVRKHQTTGIAPKERFQSVRLRPIPSPINEPMEIEHPLVHKDFAVKFDGNSYTTPPWTVGKKITLKADQHTVWLFLKEKKVCTHSRCWKRKKRIEIPSHVEQAKKLKRRQWETREFALFASLGEEFRTYLEYLPSGNGSLKKQIVTLLSLKDQYGVQSLSWAIMKALHHKAYGSDYIENILNQEMIPETNHPPVVLKNEALNRLRLNEPTLNDYDALALKRRRQS
jgi:transposase